MTLKKKILVVEDNELNLKLFTDLLEANDFEVIQDRDGRKVVEICTSESPDLIVMDIQLPNISGIDIIERLKIDEIFKKIPIVAVTAFTMQDDKVNILNSGADDYISKPISITNFIDIIKKHTE